MSQLPLPRQHLDEQLAHGRAYFSRNEALDALGLAPETPGVAVSRLIKKNRLANPRHGFYLTNHAEWLAQMKSEAGYAQVAGVELVFLDCARYFHRVAGINEPVDIEF